jgi:hypothetical protein
MFIVSATQYYGSASRQCVDKWQVCYTRVIICTVKALTWQYVSVLTDHMPIKL